LAESGSWQAEALKRIMKVQKLQGDCMRHVLPGKDSLTKQILAALLRATTKRNEPVKLSDIADIMYGDAPKDKLDVIRLTLDKTLIRCGIVDKIYFADRDVRYFPVAYRFQEISRVETGTGSKIEQLVGEVVRLPTDMWPAPTEYYRLVVESKASEDALTKLEADHVQGRVEKGTYEATKKKLLGEAESLTKKLRPFSELDEIMSQDR
jgi:hypothetical protein